MAKKNALDRAIESLQGEMAVLQLALNKLIQQKASAPVRRKAKPEVAAPMPERTARANY